MFIIKNGAVLLAAKRNKSDLKNKTKKLFWKEFKENGGRSGKHEATLIISSFQLEPHSSFIPHSGVELRKKIKGEELKVFQNKV